MRYIKCLRAYYLISRLKIDYLIGYIIHGDQTLTDLIPVGNKQVAKPNEICIY